MEKLIYFIRHGQTDYNLNRIIQGSGVDSDLNATGRAQAQAFFNHYQFEPFDFLFASGLRRSQQTIEPFTQLNIPVEYNPLINEINWGIHEGKSYDPVLIDSYKQLVEQWKTGNFEATVEGGESAQTLGDRCNLFLDQIAKHTGKQLLICTHGRTLRCLMSQVEGKALSTMENYQHHNTGLYLVKHSAEKGFEILKRNDIQHLEKAALDG